MEELKYSDKPKSQDNERLSQKKLEAEQELHKATHALLEEFKKNTDSIIINIKEQKEVAEAYGFNSTLEGKHTLKLSKEDLEKASQMDFRHSAWRNPNQKKGVEIKDLKLGTKQYKELLKKGDLAKKEIVKKLIEITEVNHSVFLKINDRLGDILLNKFGLNIFSINKETVILRLNKIDLDKLKKTDIKDYIDSQSESLQNGNQNLEQIQKMDGILRDFIFAEIVTDKSSNLGILGTSLINNQACNQYFEYYRQATGDETGKKFVPETDKFAHEIDSSGINKEVEYDETKEKELSLDARKMMNNNIGPFRNWGFRTNFRNRKYSPAVINLVVEGWQKYNKLTELTSVGEVSSYSLLSTLITDMNSGEISNKKAEEIAKKIIEK